jgi:DNA-binding Lrp family transcriptional regulator
MDLSRPYQAVAPGLHGDVLHELVVLAPGEGVSGRELARRVGASPEGVRKVLRGLERHGLVEAIEVPPARRYRLNHDHVASEAVAALSGLRARLFERIAEVVTGWDPQPVNVTVYGSAARGDGDLDSDIDVLVVAPDEAVPGGYTWDGTAGGELLSRLHAWTGNHAELTEYSLSEVRAMARAHHGLIDEIRRDGVTIFGRSIDDALRSTATSRAR